LTVLFLPSALALTHKEPARGRAFATLASQSHDYWLEEYTFPLKDWWCEKTQKGQKALLPFARCFVATAVLHRATPRLSQAEDSHSLSLVFHRLKLFPASSSDDPFLC
jgi:hypothetical protein